jgi:hypothetical protein
MKTFTRILAGVGLCAGVAAVGSLSMPANTAAFSTIGGSLSLSQRDFRVWNNFSDVTANNNTVPHASFPGHTGAVMAIWKATVEWASEAFAGTGAGDGAGSNPVLGSGGANFDTTFQGLHTSSGGGNGNVHSEEIDNNPGGTLAYTQTPISDGWTIRYLSAWTWQDGPGTVSSGVDLQGVACHEYGHALGLGHSNVGNATMFPSISGTGVGQRSIEADDIAGVQSIYGVKSGTKCHIGAIAGTKQIGDTLTITGTNFSTTGNEVWFTKATAPDGNPIKVTGVASSGGGTVINVTIPGGVADGEVLVKNSGNTGSALSNAWPLDVGAGAGDPPFLASINPTTGPAGGYTSVTLTGTGFSGTSLVKFGANDAISFIVNSATSITAIAPPGTLFDNVDVFVMDPEGSSTLPTAYIYTFNPAPNIDTVTPNTGTTLGGTRVTITGPSVVGVSDVQFDGVSGTDLEINAATELTITTPAGSAGGANVVAIGAGSDTIVNGYTYINTGSFQDLGPGKSGTLGFPTLTGLGDLTPGSTEGFTLTVDNAFPFQNATMFVSLTSVPTPFKGGTFYPLPILTSLLFATDSFGQVVLPTAIPVGTPSISIVLQFWIQDPFATKGTSATNGLKANIP